jgi:chemotaxis protein MotA
MDKASLFGVVVGTSLVLTAILLGGSLTTFVNVQGLLIVAGGTFAAVCIAFPTAELKLIFPVTRRVFKDPGNEMLDIVKFMLRAAQIFKRDGPLGLEKVVSDAPNKAVSKGLQLIADGAERIGISSALTGELS